MPGRTLQRRRHLLHRLTRPAGWSVSALLALLGAAPALAIDVRYEGRRDLVRGSPECSSAPSEVTVDIGADGGVRGEVLAADGILHFYGTLSSAGKLLGSYRTSLGAEYTSVEGVVSGDSIEGVTQSKSCRYRFRLTRR